MKSYTSIEQAKKLAEFLPLESADMNWHELPSIGLFVRAFPYKQDNGATEGLLPCWSLAALLGVIPKPDLVQNSEGTWLLHSWVNDYPWSVGGYSNPVDACYEMILKLHEMNLL